MILHVLKCMFFKLSTMQNILFETYIKYYSKLTILLLYNAETILQHIYSSCSLINDVPLHFHKKINWRRIFTAICTISCTCTGKPIWGAFYKISNLWTYLYNISICNRCIMKQTWMWIIILSNTLSISFTKVGSSYQ